jgi:hypothetical protein
MTIAAVLAKVDRLKGNQVTEADKIGWLSDCDMSIQKTIIQTHEYKDADGVIVDPPAFTGYAADVDQTTVLLAEPPYDELYTFYLYMQIDLVNMEFGKYNKDMELYNMALANYEAAYNRGHLPLHPATYIKL